jgi:uncharacterized protein (DUF2267 family)
MNDLITEELLLDALAAAGVADHRAARRVARATLYVMFQRLTADERRSMRRCLALPLSRGLPVTDEEEPIDAAEIYRRVAQRARLAEPVAREQAQIVIESIGRHASYECLQRLRNAFPTEIRALFYEREIGDPPRHVETFPAAQAHSVVRENNPHGDRKLSSGKPVFRSSDPARGARE